MLMIHLNVGLNFDRSSLDQQCYEAVDDEMDSDMEPEIAAAYEVFLQETEEKIAARI
jgi:hypothetical protein